MPTQVVDVDLQSETGAITQRTFSDLLVVARDPSVADPTYNTPLTFDSASQVASEFGSDSDAAVASEFVERQGARNWWVVCLETTSHSEVVGDSDSESTDTGQVENTPLRGGEENITVTLDGNEQILTFDTASPPDKPASGEAAINTDTGEVVTGESSDGAQAGIEVEYETLSWDEAQPDIDAGGYDLAVLADTRADRSYIGELDELLNWASRNDGSVVAAYGNGNDYASDEDAMEAAHDTGAYLTSGDFYPIAHKSDDDVAAGVAGRLATKRPWFNPYMDGGANYSFSMDEYRRALIGGPSQPGTFEGGDSQGDGPCNVLYREQGTQILSNSLTTAGADSNYQFFDVSRTESFIIAQVQEALRGLRLRRENIPFAPIGRTLILAALRDRLNQYVASSGRALTQEEIDQIQQQDGDDEQPAFYFDQPTRTTDSQANVPLSELDISVPRYDDLDQSDRANRTWSGIQITAQLAGNVHVFSVELAVQV